MNIGRLPTSLRLIPRLVLSLLHAKHAVWCLLALYTIDLWASDNFYHIVCFNQVFIFTRLAHSLLPI